MAVNDFGQVVGWSDAKNGFDSQTAFLWENGVMRDLNVVAQTGDKPHLVWATSINNVGHIGGFTQSPRSNKGEHGFVLIPNGQ